MTKSHSGVRSEFGRLAKDTPSLDKTFSTFLEKAYGYKEIGDYRVDQGATVSDTEAADLGGRSGRLHWPLNGPRFSHSHLSERSLRP